MEKESRKSIQEMQILEQSIQSVLIQKQAFQIELNEVQSALNELENSRDDVYKAAGQLMIKFSKSKAKEELEQKKKLLELRINSLDRQESSMTSRMENIRNKIIQNQKK